MNELNELTDLAVVAQGYNPGISPNFNAPWMPSLQNIGGMVMATAIVVLGIVLVLGAVLWAAGKLGAGPNAQGAGLKVLLYGTLGAVIIGSAGGIIAWATGVPLFA
ncbi:hypothetical protein [Microbacterium sp. A93]|uniref:hypothetical protein n=1 Tax=Microbacterium sp. A93 TaxID=3450716 RepID=UPI003F424A80